LRKTRRILNRAYIGENRQHADARHAHEQPAGRIRPHQYPDCLIESRYLLAQLPPSDEHGADNRRDIGTVFQENLNLPIKS
jgi:hypothetical protein